MRSCVSKVVVFLLCIAMFFVFPLVSSATEHPYGIWIDVDYDLVPPGAVYLDLLVPASEMETTVYNGSKLGIPENSEIARYHHFGLLSYTFRCPWAEAPRQKLSDPVTDSADWSFYSGYEFTRVRVAYLDETGQILAVTNTCFLNYPFECNEQLFLRGKRLIVDPLAFSSVGPGTESDVSSVRIYSVLEAVLIAAAVWVIWSLAFRISRKNHLPSFFFQKTKQREKVSGKKRGAALLVFLIRLVYFAVIAGLIFSVEQRLAWDGDWWPPLAVFAGEVLIYLLVTALNVGTHEAGHVLLGKKAGFRPVYIMVCGFGMKKENGRLRCSYHGLRLNGFVALEPPQNEPTDISFAPMYLGGIMMNGILGAVFLVLYFVFNSMAWSGILLVSAMQSFYIAWINNEASGFVRGIPGDVEQLRNLCRSAYSAPLHTDTMRISAAYYKGETVSEMPEEWFHASVAVPDDPCVACNAAAMFARLLALGAFEEAVELGMRLAAPESALQTALKAQVLTDLVLCMAATGATKEAIEVSFPRERRKAVLRMRPSPAQLRAKYAWELLAEADAESAVQTRLLYEKRFAGRGFSTAAQDQALMDACDRIAQNLNRKSKICSQ